MLKNFFQYAYFFLLFFSVLLSTTNLQAQEDLGQAELCFDRMITDGETLIVDVFLYASEPILAMQFGLEWFKDSLEFVRLVRVNDEVLPNDFKNQKGFGFPNQNNSIPENALNFSWYTIPEERLADLQGGAILFTIEFKLKTTGFPLIYLSRTRPDLTQGIFPEFTTGDLRSIPYSAANCEERSYIAGQLDLFEDGTCSTPFIATNYTGWKVVASTNEQDNYAAISSQGTFYFPTKQGEFKVQVIPLIDDIWSPCSDPVTLIVDSLNTTYDITLGAFVDRPCHLLSVDFSTPFLRRCFDNFYVCQYENLGTVTAEDAFVQISFDQWMRIDSASIPWSNQDGNLYTFPLGDLQAGTKGQFKVYFNLSCDADLGITHCSEAQIFPRSNCKSPSSDWSGASVEVEGECVDGQVQFSIRNAGQNNMRQPLEYIVTEDINALNRSNFQLQEGEAGTLNFVGNGKTFRLEAQQVPFHPAQRAPVAIVEGCSNGEPTSFNMVNQFSLGDQEFFIDLDCQVNIGSFDPNDKQAFPSGFGESNYLAPNTALEYLIRFQNTGTDTAFNIEILDTLSSLLDLTTVRSGPSSHNYHFDILEDGVLRFYFPDVLLPDSTTNEPESHGFVKFWIEQRPDLDTGLVIENRAAIYFDFNEPIITNTVFHTLHVPLFSEATIVSVNPLLAPIEVEVFPNPMEESTSFTILNTISSTFQFELYDLTGKLLRKEHFTESNWQFNRDNLTSGLFFYRIYTNRKLLSSGKLIVK